MRLGSHHKPGVRERVSAAIRARMAKPGVRERMSAAIRARMAKPGVRERMSAAIRAGMAKPGVRERMSAAIRAGILKANPPELREVRSVLTALNGRIRKVEGKHVEKESRRSA
jgi:hypothetical protein